MAKTLTASVTLDTAAATKLLRNPAGTAAAPKAKVKPTVTEAPAAPEPVASGVSDDINALFAKWGIKVPTTARIVISYIAAFVVSGVVGHIGGTLLAYTLAGCATLGASALVSFLITVVGILLTLATAWKIGGAAGNFVMSGDVDMCYEYASTKVKSGLGWAKNLFSRNDAVAA